MVGFGQAALGHEVRESAEAVLALALGEVESLVGRRYQLGRSERVVGVRGDPDAEREIRARGGGNGGGMDGIDDAVREALRARLVCVDRHYRQLLSAGPPNHVLSP